MLDIDLMFDDMWCFVIIFIIWCWIAGCFWCLFAFLFPQANSYLMPPICYCLILFEPYLTFDKMEVMVHDGSNCKIKVNTSRDVRDVDWLCFHRLMFPNIHFPCPIQQCRCVTEQWQSSVLVWQPQRRVVELFSCHAVPHAVCKKMPQGDAQCWEILVVYIGQLIGWQAGCVWNHGQAFAGMFVYLYSWRTIVSVLRALWFLTYLLYSNQDSPVIFDGSDHGAHGCISKCFHQQCTGSDRSSRVNCCCMEAPDVSNRGFE